ncbi:MAG: phage terminase large subunit family protein, partial [Ruminococcaceae bacterium]|nr:phage terminase large subunit family protein [Oscillospiraceae bacterium]
PLFKIGVDTGKALLYQRLRVTDEGPNYCHFPIDKGTGYSEEYFKGLTAEQMIMTFKKGVPTTAWRLKDKKHKRNEPLDIRVYAGAALEIHNPELKPPQSKPTTAAKRGRRTRSGGIT